MSDVAAGRRVAFLLGPAVVDVHVLIAGFPQARRDEEVRGGLDQGLVDGAAGGVPVVEAHGRC
jgi:hypothetical protein